MLYMFGKCKKFPIIVFPDTPAMRQWHYPKKSGTLAWTLTNDAGQIIDKYTPAR